MNINSFKIIDQGIEEYKQTKNADLRSKIIKMIKEVEQLLDLMKFEIQYVDSDDEAAKLNEAIEYKVPEGLKFFVLGKGLR